MTLWLFLAQFATLTVVIVVVYRPLGDYMARVYTSSKDLKVERSFYGVIGVRSGPLGIRVNQVNPGFIETPMTLSASDAFRDINIALAPLGRTGTVDDVVPIVGFLLSGSSSFITGAEIPVDGGLTSHGGAKVISDALG